jgi:uncharacterized caspase-like protein
MIPYLHLIGVACWTLVVALAGPAEARRVALVIGNNDYKVGSLHNPVSDAAAVAETFQGKLGFDKVILKKNLDFDGFRAALDELSRVATGADIAVVYFAGHGIEVGGKNFLIPIDATLVRAGALDLEAIALETVLAQLEGVRELKLVILDACRNNPFVLRGGKRSLGRGLARIEPDNTTLVVYAAKDGTTADDGLGRPHSPFTEALLKHVAAPDMEVRILFGRIGEDVAAATGHQQQPYQYGTLGSKPFYLVPKAPAPPSTAPKADAKPAPLPPSLNEVERAWAEAKDSSSIAVLEAFRRQYGAANALYDQLAAERIVALRSATGPKGAPVAAPDPPPKGASAAALDPPPKGASIAAPDSPPMGAWIAAPDPVPPDLARLIQTELKRVGCDPGTIDGRWGDKGEAALQKFTRYAKVALRTDVPTVAALEAVKGQSGRICPLECGPNTVERDGACVTKAPPSYREQPKAKTTSAPKKAAPKREKAPKKQEMCWSIEARTNSIVPCTDPRAGPRAY